MLNNEALYHLWKAFVQLSPCSLCCLQGEGSDHRSAGLFSQPFLSRKKGFFGARTPSRQGSRAWETLTALLGKAPCREKKRWARWRGNASPSIQHGPFTSPHLVLWAARQSIPASALAPTHRYPRAQPAWPAPLLQVPVCGPCLSTICLEFSTTMQQPHQLKQAALPSEILNKCKVK